MVAAGFAVTAVPVVAESQVEGDHAYVLAPDAVRETLPPGAIVAEEGETETDTEELIVVVPVETSLNAAPVEEKFKLPEAPFVAVAPALT